MDLNIKNYDVISSQIILMKEFILLVFNQITNYINLFKKVINIIMKLNNEVLIPFLVNIVNYPLIFIYNNHKFRSLTLNSVFKSILDISIFEKNNYIEVVDIIDNNNLINNSNTLFIQNHSTTINDVLLGMYIVQNYSLFPTSFIGMIFTNFKNQFLRLFCNSLIDWTTSNLINMIMLKWDHNLNKPKKNQISSLLNKCNDIFNNNWNLHFFPDKPSFTQGQEIKFKSGLSKILELESLKYICVISVLYFDKDNKLLQGEELNNFKDTKKIRCKLEYITKNKKKSGLELSEDCQSIMNNNLNYLREKYDSHFIKN